MKKNKLVVPVLKWVGGKRQLLETFRPLLPSRITTYCEPFIGGGALLFHLQPSVACINDINPELIRVYTVIKNDVEALIAELEKYENTSEYFYAVRDWDRDKEYYAKLSEVQKAARVLYLKDGGGFSVASQGFARYRETPWLQHFAGIAIFGVSMEAGGNL